MVPQLFLLWYFVPVAEIQTYPPLLELLLELLSEPVPADAGAVTVILQEAFTPLPSLAVQVIVAVPPALAVTLPALETVATAVLLLFQLTDLLPADEGVAVAFKV